MLFSMFIVIVQLWNIILLCYSTLNTLSKVYYVTLLAIIIDEFAFDYLTRNQAFLGLL